MGNLSSVCLAHIGNSLTADHVGKGQIIVRQTESRRQSDILVLIFTLLD